MDAVIALIQDIKTAQAAGASPDRLTQARDFQRKAQFYLDFIEAENSMGFHVPEEAARILAESIDFSRKGQATLAGQTIQVPSPPAPLPLAGGAGGEGRAKR